MSTQEQAVGGFRPSHSKQWYRYEQSQDTGSEVTA
jgi:hypothetical protein